MSELSMPPPPPPSAAAGSGPGDRSGFRGGWQFVPTREHPRGTLVLVLGILSLTTCGLLGPVAWKMGSTALREMDAQPEIGFANRGNVTAGRICGIIGTALLSLWLVFFVLWIAFAAFFFTGID